MTNLTADKLLAALAALIAQGTTQPKAGKASGNLGSKSQKFPPFKGGSVAAKLTKKTKAGGETTQPDAKAQFEISVLKGFYARGFKATDLELRSSGTKGVLTYKGWLKVGRQVKKGEKGVKGCFHYSQTEPQQVTESDLMAAVAEHRAAKPSYSDSDLVA